MKTSLYIFILFFLFSCNSNNRLLFEDNFDSNTHGWLEEKTNKHEITISNGVYNLINKDSISSKTSTKHLDNSWLISLPNEYQINTEFLIESDSLDKAYGGILLECNSYQYNFKCHANGEVSVTEHDYLNNVTYKYSNFGRVAPSKKFNLTIEVSNWAFTVKVNNLLIGTSDLKCKSWERICPLSGSYTNSKFEHLRISKK